MVSRMNSSAVLSSFMLIISNYILGYSGAANVNPPPGSQLGVTYVQVSQPSQTTETAVQQNVDVASNTSGVLQKVSSQQVTTLSFSVFFVSVFSVTASLCCCRPFQAR